jgi:hypothetical protein
MTDELAPQEPASDAAPVVNADVPAESSTAQPKEPTAIEKMQKRIDQLTWRNKEFERQLAAQARPEPKTPASETPKLPTLAESDYDEAKHLAAMDAYLSQLAERKAEELLSKKERERQAAEKSRTFQERQDAFIKSKPDYREKVWELPRDLMTDGLAAIIQESEIGPEVAYYLAETEEKLAEIAKLSSVSQAREIGRIEARLEAAKATPPAPPKQSSAPPPAPKIEATDSARAISSTDPDSDKLTDAEWVRAENRRLANKRKAKS